MSVLKEYTIKGYPLIIPSLLIAEVYTHEGDFLGESIVSMTQFNSPDFMDQLIKDMNMMVSKGIGMAFILPEEKGGFDEKE